MWVLWTITAGLGASAVLVRTYSGVPGPHRWLVYAAALVGFAASLVAARKPISLYSIVAGILIAVGMSASSIASGGSLGFLLLAIAKHNSVALLLAGKWATVATILTALFRYELVLVGATQRSDDPYESFAS